MHSATWDAVFINLSPRESRSISLILPLKFPGGVTVFCFDLRQASISMCDDSGASHDGLLIIEFL